MTVSVPLRRACRLLRRVRLSLRRVRLSHRRARRLLRRVRLSLRRVRLSLRRARLGLRRARLSLRRARPLARLGLHRGDARHFQSLRGLSERRRLLRRRHHLRERLVLREAGQRQQLAHVPGGAARLRQSRRLGRDHRRERRGPVVVRPRGDVVQRDELHLVHDALGVKLGVVPGAPREALARHGVVHGGVRHALRVLDRHEVLLHALHPARGGVRRAQEPPPLHLVQIVVVDENLLPERRVRLLRHRVGRLTDPHRAVALAELPLLRALLVLAPLVRRLEERAVIGGGLPPRHARDLVLVRLHLLRAEAHLILLRDVRERVAIAEMLDVARRRGPVLVPHAHEPPDDVRVLLEVLAVVLVVHPVPRVAVANRPAAVAVLAVVRAVLPPHEPRLDAGQDVDAHLLHQLRRLRVLLNHHRVAVLGQLRGVPGLVQHLRLDVHQVGNLIRDGRKRRRLGVGRGERRVRGLRRRGELRRRRRLRHAGRLGRGRGRHRRVRRRGGEHAQVVRVVRKLRALADHVVLHLGMPGPRVSLAVRKRAQIARVRAARDVHGDVANQVGVRLEERAVVLVVLPQTRRADAHAALALARLAVEGRAAPLVIEVLLGRRRRDDLGRALALALDRARGSVPLALRPPVPALERRALDVFVRHDVGLPGLELVPEANRAVARALRALVRAMLEGRARGFRDRARGEKQTQRRRAKGAPMTARHRYRRRDSAGVRRAPRVLTPRLRANLRVLETGCAKFFHRSGC